MIATAEDASLLPSAHFPSCQYCGSGLSISWLDLGRQPLSNDYRPLAAEAVAAPQYPLHARVCPECWLVQVDRVVPPGDIFSDYAYFSSYSDSWLAHCRAYAEMVIERFSLGEDSLVVEIASNDGYLLKNFAERGIPVLGVDPAENVAAVARAAGIPTETEFFGSDFARELVERGIRADHLSAKNVLAHVPDIGDFVRGVAILLAPKAVFTVEFPHLLSTMRELQFDQIYHEHFTYLSLVAIDRVLGDNGLRIFDVEELSTHGGSLRVFVCHADAPHATTGAVAQAIGEELEAGLRSAEGYAAFTAKVEQIRAAFLNFVAEAKAEGKSIAGYGAAAKGNTFLNYCAADSSTLTFIADRSPAKTGKYMPGSGIAIRSPEAVEAERPDYLVILPWNLSHEIAGQMEGIRSWGGRFVTAIPKLHIF
jgi:SAM-dependent methyltransferase